MRPRALRAAAEANARTVLFVYDFILTFPQEIKCIWSRRFSGASLLFAVNRYAVLVNRLVRLVQLVQWKGYTEAEADYVRVHSAFCVCCAQGVRPIIPRREYNWQATAIVNRLNALRRCNAVWRVSEVCTILMYVAIAGASTTLRVP